MEFFQELVTLERTKHFQWDFNEKNQLSPPQLSNQKNPEVFLQNGDKFSRLQVKKILSEMSCQNILKICQQLKFLETMIQ